MTPARRTGRPQAAVAYTPRVAPGGEVARELNISPASGRPCICAAKSVVIISTSTQSFADDVLARQLEDAFGLARRGIGAWRPGRRSRGAPRARPSAPGSFWSWSPPAPGIGVAWGRTMTQLADVMAFADLQDVTVVNCAAIWARPVFLPRRCATKSPAGSMPTPDSYAPLVLLEQTGWPRHFAAAGGCPGPARRHCRLRPGAVFGWHRRRRHSSPGCAQPGGDGRAWRGGAAAFVAGQPYDGGRPARCDCSYNAA